MEEGDLERWRELSGFEATSSDDGEETRETEGIQPDNIGKIDVVDDIYSYCTAAGAPIHIRHETKKGLSFQIWPSSLSLAKYAEEQNRLSPGFWKGKHVMELGCGCGLAGLVFACLGATVALTDLPETMVAPKFYSHLLCMEWLSHAAMQSMLERNIALNQEQISSSGGAVHAFPLVWGETDLSPLPDMWRTPDTVVAADVVYHKHLFSPLLTTLLGLAGRETRIVLAHVRRWKDDKVFFNAARKSFVVEDITASAALENDEPVEQASHTKGALRLYRLQLRKDCK